MAGFPTATLSQLLSKIIAVMPQPSKITGLAYMEATEGPPETRNAQALLQQLDTRYGKTDIERSWAWLQEFTAFIRKPSENIKDFWARLQRVATRLGTLNMKMSEEAISPNALQALKLTESHLPIALSDLETNKDSHIVEGLRDITIRMFETHRHAPDRSDVFAT